CWGLRGREGWRLTASFVWSMRTFGTGTTRRKCGRSTSALGFVSSSSAASYVFLSLDRSNGRNTDTSIGDWLSAGATCGWKDRSSTGWRTPAHSTKAASLAYSRTWSRVLILGVREICPCLPNAQQTCCERTGRRTVQQREELVALHATAATSQRPLLTTPQHACVPIGESRLNDVRHGSLATDYTSRFRVATSR